MVLFYILGFIAFVWFVLAFPYFRCFVFNIGKSVFNGVRDIFFYFKHKEYNDAEPTVGKMICFSGLFGHGKTLSEVHYITSLYNRYNGKKVWKDGKFVTQRIHVLSNINLTSIPYIEFTNLNQLCDITTKLGSYDDDNDTYSIVYVIIDELQNLLYCRSFKTNLSSDVLSVLTQIRKLRCLIVYTSTRFSQSDATIRQDTTYVVDCNKHWRLAGNWYYDAWDYENATSLDLIKPMQRTCWFVRNKDYKAYDTHALTEIISKDVTTGNVVPVELRNIDSDSEKRPRHLSKKGKKFFSVKAS